MRTLTQPEALVVIDVNEVAPADTYCRLGEADNAVARTQGKKLTAVGVIDVGKTTSLHDVGDLLAVISSGRRVFEQHYRDA